jgi:hypothetical protein
VYGFKSVNLEARCTTYTEKAFAEPLKLTNIHRMRFVCFRMLDKPRSCIEGRNGDMVRAVIYLFIYLFAFNIKFKAT